MLLRETLAILQGLARQVRSTTPFVLLSQAAEELQVRPLLRQRQDRSAERALANLDLFLESARAYDLRGLLAFAADLRVQWEEARRTIEGRPDTEEQSVSLVTMHSSKGLEWPVVIPINLGGRPYDQLDAALDADGRLHLPVFGLHGPGGEAAFEAESEQEARQRHRLWYVAATRARDLLLLPKFSTGVPSGSWAEHIDLRHEGLDPFNADSLAPASLHRTADPPNSQDRAQFDTEAALIAARALHIRRITPHLVEADEVVAAEQVPLPTRADEDAQTPAAPRGSRARGLILHKLLEEVLTGETADDDAALRTRAAELAGQLAGFSGVEGFDAAEAALSARRGLAVPEIAAVRASLLPEYSVAHSDMADGEEVVTQGVADAVAWEGDRIRLVVDWKSDVNPNAATVAQYRGQVLAYLRATGAPAGVVVFLTSGAVEHVVGS